MKEQPRLSTINQEDQLPAEWIDRIFSRFHGRFGNSFLAKWQVGVNAANGEDAGIRNAKKIWAEELAGYTVEEIKRGLASKFDYPPSCDEFGKKCRPSLDYEMSFVEACQQMHKRKNGLDSWSNPFVYWAAVKLGNDLNSYPYQSIKSRWIKAVNDSIEAIKNGDLPNRVPEKMTELPPPGKTTVSPEEAAKRFAEVHNILNSKIVK